VRRTPLLQTDLHESLVIMAECLQVTGSFKSRGACNAVACLGDRAMETTGVVTHSSGNHATALSYAAQTFRLPALMVIPATASPNKVEATRRLGAEVITHGITFDNREQVAEEIAVEQGLHLIHTYDDWDIVHGGATTGLEILEDASTATCLVAPVGGGGQISGLALSVQSFCPTAAVIGVEPELADDAARSFSTGQLQTLTADPPTIAEGVKSKAIGERNFEVMVRRRLVADMVTVSEQELVETVCLAWQTLRLTVEPTGALGLAWLSGRIHRATPQQPTVVLLSGGNFEADQMARILTGGDQ